MINNPTVYYSIGKAAAIAANEGDEARKEVEKQYYRTCRNLETEEDAKIAYENFDAGWRDNRRVPK